MVTYPVFRGVVDEFDAGAREEEVLVGRFGSIAAMVEPVGLHVRGKLTLHFTRVRVAAGHGARIAALSHGTIPHQSAGNKDVIRGAHVSAWMVWRLPQRLAVLNRQGKHGRNTLPGFRDIDLSAVQNHIVVQDQCGTTRASHAFFFGQWLRRPQ